MALSGSTLAVLRDSLVVAVIAVLTVQGLRRWVGDRYLVPSGSMQPVLYGDPVNGDIVFVDKTVAAETRGRGDLVVVENERLPGHQLVKRIAACGDDHDACWINIRHGDLLLGPDAQHMSIAVKDPREALLDAIPWADAAAPPERPQRFDLTAGDGPGGTARLPLRLPAAWSNLVSARAAFRPRAHRARFRKQETGVLPVGAIGTRLPVDASFVDITGKRSTTGGDVLVADCGATLQFDVSGEPLAESSPPSPAVDAAVLATIDSTDFATTFVWIPAKNYVEVWLDGKKVREAHDVLRQDWRGGLTFGRLDGRDYLLLDDTGEVVLATPSKPTILRPRTWLHVASSGDAAVVQGLRVFRDIYYYRHEGVGGSWPRFVDQGHWFLLGDNTFDSEDSRYHGAVSADLFLGVPRWVIAPFCRSRRLLR